MTNLYHVQIFVRVLADIAAETTMSETQEAENLDSDLILLAIANQNSQDANELQYSISYVKWFEIEILKLCIRGFVLILLSIELVEFPTIIFPLVTGRVTSTFPL